MIVTYWPLLVSLGAVGLAFFLGVVWGRRGAAGDVAAELLATSDWQRVVANVELHGNDQPDVSDEELLVEVNKKLLSDNKQRMAKLSAQLIKNQEQIIELLRAQLIEQEARVVSVEKLAHDWARKAAERQRRINELEVRLVVEQGTIAQLRVVNAEIQKRLDQATPEAS